MIESIPDVVLIGDLELLFLGLAFGAGAPKVARGILSRRYGVGDGGNDGAECDDCPTPDKCAERGCREDR